LDPSLSRPSRPDPPSLWPDPLSSWLDLSPSWLSRSDPPLPLLSCRRRLPWPASGPSCGGGHPDQRRRVCCRRLSWQAPRRLDTERSKKVHDAVVVLFVSPHRPFTLERRPISTLATSTSGTIIYMECTTVSTLATTFAPSRHCDGGRGGLARRLLPLALLQSHCFQCSCCDCGGC
jgi:hypothetical protein